ncbi:MAG TPA: aminotransferase class V-fold PLP-dependent enzyme [Phycisphaerae bacterium]|nr:aminotransferase class V-fold PLP-dependent enzyme [Phycisphaerae bacterium]
MIYLDNNATTQMDPAVREAMLPYLGELYGNPSSTHRFGQESRQALEKSRHQVAGLLGCDVRELIFTSGGTESDNAAIHGLLAVRAAGGARKVIVTSSVEHSAVRTPVQALAKSGYTVVEIGVDGRGALDLERLSGVLAERGAEVALVSIMWANNETGVLFDVARIGAICREHAVPLHVDGVQAVGKIGFALRDLPIDVFSVSAHKFHGPKGVGALYVRRGARWQPWIRGGPQERDRRGGTENVAGIVGMGVAAELAGRALANGGEWERVAGLRDALERGILERIPDSHVNGDPAKRLANTTNIGFAGLEAEAILLLLSEQDVCASAGAACSSGSLEPSHVLRAMALPDRVAHGAVRFSLSRRTSEADVRGALEVLPGVIERLRATLPV